MLKLLKIFCMFLFVFTGIAQAQGEIAVPSTAARAWANSKGNELIQALATTDTAVKYAKLDKMMTEDVNLDYISKFVIGKYARLMDNEQKQKYESLFRRYALSLYKKTNLDFDVNNINFTINTVSEYPKFTNVICTVDLGKLTKDIEIEKIPVKFKLIRSPDHNIQAVDVEISNVSMVIEYRKRFYQMIHDEDENIDWFLEKFEDKVKANEESITAKPTTAG